MKNNWDKILDECIDRINRGESIEGCLAEYPEYREELGSLLHAMLDTKSAYSFTPSVPAKNFHRQRLTAALVASRERRTRRKPVFTWILGWSKVWAPVAAAIVIALVGYFGLRPALMSPAPVDSQSLQSSDRNNFRLLISDDVNEIENFSELWVMISGIGFHQGGESGSWFTEEFEEEDWKAVNIEPLRGKNSVVLWEGWLPVSEDGYDKVFIYVEEAWGTLNEGVEPPTDDWTIKLPSGKLQISETFSVDEGSVADFVFDITVVRAGKSGKFILKPQVADSGTDQEYVISGGAEDENEIEFNGTISYEPDLVIGDYNVIVDENTEIEGDLTEGLAAEVEGILQEDGISVLALKIKVEDVEEE